MQEIKSIGILKFPCSTCYEDSYYMLAQVFPKASIYTIDFRISDIKDDYDLIFIPGGYSFGDAIYPGYIASKQPVMNALYDLINKKASKVKVIGICNGFQILTSSGLLPGRLSENNRDKFISMDVDVEYKGHKFNMKIANHCGTYHSKDQPNGGEMKYDSKTYDIFSNDHIAGVFSVKKNVFGCMPHPDRFLSFDKKNISETERFINLIISEMR